ncbi:glycosyltransferase family 2 protein [Puniceicoccus vermicola]|uniref:Glycosyltransferase n=1 Tax=Puniceicoccus vermicola TaxID=388746 RepID=A0A7X1E5Z5_9BACT|nr:glycosyltransferase family A protein [Puniceicoccus vermicola]MBC2602122.1 glycosyltransferase [Puniceicoccus vermicola]
MARVTILLPVRNGAQTLEAAVESILQQTFKDWRLLIVDDHSTDRTRKLAEGFSAEDRRILSIQAVGRGIVAALNEGLARVSSPFVARMDVDDYCHPERLRWQCEFLEENPEIGVVSCRTWQDGGGRGYQRYMDWTNSILSVEEHFQNRFVESPVAHPSVVFRREIPDRFGGYRAGDFPEDYEMWLRWMDQGVRFQKIPEFLLEWRDSEKRLSRSDPRYRPEAFYEIKSHFLGRWLEREIPADRPLWLWGAGRVTRRRFRSLEDSGHRFAGFLDIDPKKIGQTLDGRPVEDPRDLAEDSDRFLLFGVGARGARERATQFLESRGYRIGKDFLAVA